MYSVSGTVSDGMGLKKLLEWCVTLVIYHFIYNYYACTVDEKYLYVRVLQGNTD